MENGEVSTVSVECEKPLKKSSTVFSGNTLHSEHGEDDSSEASRTGINGNTVLDVSFEGCHKEESTMKSDSTEGVETMSHLASQSESDNFNLQTSNLKSTEIADAYREHLHFGTCEMSESSSLLEERTTLDHPLRTLSCLELDGSSNESQVPKVAISNPRTNAKASECIPLHNLFHSQTESSEPRWVERLGYKNWLLHLARRRRCEILILAGFVVWIMFFIVLAIVMNGNAARHASDGNLITVEDESNQNLSEGTIVVNSNSVTPNMTSPLFDPTVNVSSKEKTASNIPHSSEITTAMNASASDAPNTHLAFAKKHDIPKIDPEYAKPTVLPSGVGAGESTMAITDSVDKQVNVSRLLLSNGDFGIGTSPATKDEKLDAQSSNYLIGVGRSDITGPAADVNMMGYANPGQTSGGIHLRQYSRAFIVEDLETRVRTVFVNIDACMASTLVKMEVLKVLKTEFGDLYTAENLCISGTHTHSGPAGFLQDVLFQISSWGYVEETLSAMVKGIVESIKIAHESTQPGYIVMNKGDLVGSNINRSPSAYENNPEEERAKYKYNVDTDMVLLKFMDLNGKGIGMINWFPVHCTSMNNTNHLISSDNKGYAEILFENYIDRDVRPGESAFVAAFAQSNEGDVSPNTRGPHCLDTGEPCDIEHSTCNGKSQYCVASGPGKDMFESTKIIGENQFVKAKELYLSATVKLKGPVKFIHEYVNMTDFEVVLKNSTKVKTCKPAMGFSFAAGTTDGPGAFDFKQGDKSGNKFWNVIRNFLHSPSKEQVECHFPKPILLDTGEMDAPYEWQPQVIDTQILQIGQFFIVALPGEFSTMAGRRLRDGVYQTLKTLNTNADFQVTLAGLSNSYSDYITTHEEYLIQRYEGASTIYGPYTSEAYTQQFRKLALYLTQNRNVTSSVAPVDIKDKLMSFQVGVIYDGKPFSSNFGDVSSEAKTSYTAGDEVTVKFVAGNPRNCLHVENKNMTFLSVEKEVAESSWETMFTDADWDTKFTWVRTSTIRGLSDAIISWQTHKSTSPGKYRISHYGCYKSLVYGIYPYSGTSKAFTITSS